MCGRIQISVSLKWLPTWKVLLSVGAFEKLQFHIPYVDD
jgi:hypothetical protein